MAMEKKLNYKEALAESLTGGPEIVYNTYGMPKEVFIKSLNPDGSYKRGGWFSVDYVKKVRRMAGLPAQFEDSKSQNA